MMLPILVMTFSDEGKIVTISATWIEQPNMMLLVLEISVNGKG